jgi:hypothetical protein
MFAHADWLVSIERRPADDQLEEQYNQSKHEHQGNDHPAKVEYPAQRTDNHQKRENCPEHQSTSMMPSSALSLSAPDCKSTDLENVPAHCARTGTNAACNNYDTQRPGPSDLICTLSVNTATGHVRQRSGEKPSTTSSRGIRSQDASSFEQGPAAPRKPARSQSRQKKCSSIKLSRSARGQGLCLRLLPWLHDLVVSEL